MINEVGNQYGKLTVIERAARPEGRPKGAYWLCQCDCGSQKVVRGVELRTGGTKSCGCILGEHSTKNEIGNQYGRLTVIAHSNQRSGNCVCWVCQCECGNIAVVSGASLRSGTTRSCGCLMKEKSRESNGVNRAGQRFNKLTAIEIDETATVKRKNGIYWKCLCDCGNYTVVNGTNLSSGIVKSCGCIKTSYGEEVIEKILQEQSIAYKREYCLPDLCGDKGVLLRFDFAIFDSDNNLYSLIEYDGEQHYKSVPMWGGEEGLQKRRYNDTVKNNYCQEHNIKLIRIPYQKICKIAFEDLEIDINELSYQHLDK